MLEGCISNPDKRIWYAVWNMELKASPGTIVGDFCFKGLGDDGVIEIGYGLKEAYRHHGYMTEAVNAITEWALSQENVKQVEAETDEKILHPRMFLSGRDLSGMERWGKKDQDLYMEAENEHYGYLRNRQEDKVLHLWNCPDADRGTFG